MQFETTHENLRSALGRLAKIPSKQKDLPVLGCVLFEADKGALKLSATNLDVGAEINLPVKLEQEGSVAVPETVLLPYVLNLAGSQKISCKMQGGGLVLTCGGKKAVIKTMPHDEFPAIPKVKDGVKVKLGVSELLLGLRAVIYAASTGTLKPELCGVLIKIGDDGVTFVATDAFRLTEKKLLKGGFNEDSYCSAIVPYKNAHDIIRVFEGAETPLDIVIGDHQLSVTSGNVYFTTRLIDAAFPDYEKLFPSDHTSEVTALKSDLSNAMKTAQIFSDKFSQIIMRISPTKGVFEITSSGSGAGDHMEDVDAVLEGEDVEMRFNWRYVLDCLNNMPSDSVNLKFYGPGRPITIRGVGDTSFVSLLMPLNVSTG